MVLQEYNFSLRMCTTSMLSFKKFSMGNLVHPILGDFTASSLGTHYNILGFASD